MSEFYAVSAQVLPLLFLAVAVEFRLLQASEQELSGVLPADRPRMVAASITAIVAFVLTVSIGELAALRGVAEQETLRFANQLIIMSLVASGVALMVTPLMNLLWTLDKVHEAEAKQRAIEAGRTYTHMPGRAATWFSRLGLVVVLAVLATPVYGLVVVLQLVM